VPLCSRFLQGPNTDPEHVRKLRESVQNGTCVTVRLLNCELVQAGYRPLGGRGPWEGWYRWLFCPQIRCNFSSARLRAICAAVAAPTFPVSCPLFQLPMLHTALQIARMARRSGTC
jgi:hypothetical protein